MRQASLRHDRERSRPARRPAAFGHSGPGLGEMVRRLLSEPLERRHHPLIRFIRVIDHPRLLLSGHSAEAGRCHRAICTPAGRASPGRCVAQGLRPRRERAANRRKADRAGPEGASMTRATLTITSKNHSSWSLRGWLLARFAGLDFEERLVPADDPAMRAELLLLSSSILVPCLDHDGISVWDTLAIGEYRDRSEEHTSELQSLAYLVCRLLLEK